jgi:hypothetical protein
VAYAVDFASLLLLGPHKAMVVAAASALAACRLNKKEQQPLRDTLFSMAVMVLTVQGAGLALAWLTEPGATTTLATIGRPLVGTATVYSLVSTGLVATALALSSHTSIARTWRAGVVRCAPGSFVGACTAAMASALVLKTGYWIAPLGFAPIYLTYRTRKRTSAACRRMPPAWPRRSGCRPTRSSASRPPRCCTTSASSRCPNTFSRSRGR